MSPVRPTIPQRDATAPQLIEWTGERCVPWTPDLQVVHEHLHRYLWAAEVVRGLQVLDLASGEGYGAAILASTADSVVGVDVDRIAVEHSKAGYRADNLSFDVADALDLTRLGEQRFDAVVAFEMIEHLDDHDLLLAQIKLVLKPGGLLILSTPDRSEYARTQDNPFHVHELDRDEFRARLAAHFAHVVMFGQRAMVGSVLWELDRAGDDPPDMPVAFVEQTTGGWRRTDANAPMYLVAVASDGELPELPVDSTLAECRVAAQEDPGRRDAVAVPGHVGDALGVIVLGMARSGTSAVAGMFAEAGFSLGPEAELMAANSGNPRGYFEHQPIVDLNDEILDELGGRWYQPPAAEAFLAARSRVSDRLRSTLDRLLEHAGDAPLILKDPRIGVMLELWGPVLARRFHPVVVIRDPIEIAISLERRDGTPLPFGLAEWELHMTTLLRQLQGSVVTIAPLRKLASLELAAEIVATAAAHLTHDRASRVHPDRAAARFDPALPRSRREALMHEEAMTPRQSALWAYLGRLSPGDLTIDPPASILIDSETSWKLVAAERSRRETCRELDAQSALAKLQAETLERLNAEISAERESTRAQFARYEEEVERLRLLVRSEQARLEAELRDALAEKALLASLLAEVQHSNNSGR